MDVFDGLIPVVDFGEVLHVVLDFRDDFGVRPAALFDPVPHGQ